MVLIVNADDLGTNEATNDAIFAAMDSGVVTSATLIANSPAFDHAVAGAARYPRRSFGVHLNATVFAPLAPSAGLAPILDERGHLSARLFTTPIGASLAEAILAEWRAQVRRVLEAGVVLSHFDSHQHVHVIARLFPVLKALQREFGVRRVRNTINLLPFGERMGIARGLRKAAYSIALRNWYGTRTTDAFGDFQDFLTWVEAGKVPLCRSLEVMVHPGAKSPHYVREKERLESNWRSPAFRLATYHEI